MKKLLSFLFLPTWILWCTIVFIFHWGTLPEKDYLLLLKTPQKNSSLWIPATIEQPLQHLVLNGSPFERGFQAGQHTKDLLYEQEVELTTMLENIFPYKFLFQLFELVIIPIFKGAEQNVPLDFLQEMYGVSKATSEKFNSYAEPFTRQFAYHGLYEVGQMMVDQYQDDRLENMGCTALVAKQNSSWMVGRNFDFEGGKTLDEKKIVKWVFPENKYSYVSVIWAGMVGSVTAVNEHGLYLSINAASTSEFNRHGLPTTLLLTRVMDSAKTSSEALHILQQTPTIASALFVLVSAREDQAFRVEKSPHHTEVISLEKSSAITNHFISPRWKEDPINQFRRENLTSSFREARGQELLDQSPTSLTEEEMAQALRDKKGPKGAPRPWGHRQSIDALIANHSVIYNGKQEHLFISVGPHLTAEYLGYDLKKSFQQHRPSFVRKISGDAEMPKENLESYTNFEQQLTVLSDSLRKKQNADDLIQQISVNVDKHPALENPQLHHLLGHRELARNNSQKARVHFQKALDLIPAYKREHDEILKELNEIH